MNAWMVQKPRRTGTLVRAHERRQPLLVLNLPDSLYGP